MDGLYQYKLIVHGRVMADVAESVNDGMETVERFVCLGDNLMCLCPCVLHPCQG